MTTPAHFDGADDVAKLTSAPRSVKRHNGWYGSAAGTRPLTREDSREMADTAWAISSRLMAGLLLYTGLGWLLSLWLGHSALLMGAGALIGIALAFWLSFAQMGSGDEHDPAAPKSKSSP